MSNAHYILDLDDDLIEADWSAPSEEEQSVISFADGFATAVAICPEDIPCHEWFAALRGDESAFEDWGGVGFLVEFMRIRKRRIDQDLRRDGSFQPYFVFSDDEKEVYVSWIIGFAKAMAMRPDAWRLYGEAGGGVAVASFVLLGAAVEGRTEVLGDIDDQSLAEINAMAPAIIVKAVKMLAEERKTLGIRRRPAAMQDKIGRNDPCPCGSGNKFKKCCAARAHQA